MIRLAPLLLALVVLALALSLVEGAPERLPGVALGSEVLLHLERAGAAFAIVVAVLSVLAQAAHGRLPTQLSTSGLAYDTEATTAGDRLQRQVDELDAELEALRALFRAMGDRI